MNETIFEPYYDAYIIGENLKTIKVAFIGNSITWHDPSEKIGWDHKAGMAASSIENDYVHRTVEKIARNKNVNVEFVVNNIADWEREFEDFDFSRIKGINNFKPDYTIFQLGENVAQADIEIKTDSFINNYISLINYIETKNNEIICLPFWYSKEKVQAITKVAIKTNSYLVDLSHLGNGLDKRNYVKSEMNYKHQGVAVHPGDFGMENISDNIYSIFNVILNE